VTEALGRAQLEWAEAAPDSIPVADLHIVAGIWEEAAAHAACCLAANEARVVLAPALYWSDITEKLLSDFRGRAEALWYVSWDQAVQARRSWGLADHVEVVRCAVDTERFRPGSRPGEGSPWILCRHSRDAPEKFAPNVPALLDAIGGSHDIVFRMLGARKMGGAANDRRIHAFAEGEVDVAEFLRVGDLWVYSHAPHWRETACIAMLEAMACGLPVLVNNTGGMREYLPHGRGGFACTDLDEYCEYARLLLDCAAVRREMAEAARQHVVTHYSIAALAGRLRMLLKI
jgi:glycosyltransferase involved in cell wall biosynthesis